jgi:bacteriorhodopsin
MKRVLRILRAKELKPLYAAVFITCCVLFLAHQITQRVLHLRIGFADNYLDNFLATPILLTLLLVERRTLFRRGRDYTLSVAEVCLATAFIAVVGEVLFPYLSDDFTSDWLDVPFYALGSVLFYATVNKTDRSAL